MSGFRVSLPTMTEFLVRWSWLDDGVLPGLIAIIRAFWIWPWLALVQLGLSPDFHAAALPLWGVLLLPILSFVLARWASSLRNGTAAVHDELSDQLPLVPRLMVALLGLLAAVWVVWWQLYQSEFGLLNVTWVNHMGDSLIHWPETSIPPAVVLIVTVLLLWLRGLLDAGNSLTHDTVWRVFLTGIVMMVLYLIVITLSNLEREAQLVTSILGMLAAGMGALAFSSVKITAGLDRALGMGIRHIGESEGDEIGPLQSAAMPVVNRYWFLSVGGVISFLLTMGILLTLLIAPEVIEAVLNVLWAVASFVGDIIVALLIGLAYVGAIIFFYLYQFIEPLIQRLLERLNLDPELLESLSPEPAETVEATEVVERAPVPDEYRWLGLVIIGIITLVVFALVIRRLSTSDTEVLDEERESILSADLLQDQLSSLWDRLRGRFQTQDADDPFMPLDGEESRRRIRAVYQRLLAAAHDVGQPREPAATPVEYEERLTRTRQDAGSINSALQTSAHDVEGDELTNLRDFYGQRYVAQLERITAGYVAARYGDEAPPSSVAADVEAAWQEIQRDLDQD